jgi:hypothetical protein
MDDLAELDRLLARADRVVAMETIAAGETAPGVIGMRHDVDNFIAPAVQMAEWEAERGYRSTYFILHTAPYWQQKGVLRAALERIAGCGHEIGIHTNALAAALVTGGDPVEILEEAIAELRGYGYPVKGVVAHGDNICHAAGFINDEMFLESARPGYGEPDRVLVYGGRRVQIQPVSRERFGLAYDAVWQRRVLYLSDSGGRWNRPFDEVSAAFPDPAGQLHALIHPDWWPQAFSGLRVAA